MDQLATFSGSEQDSMATLRWLRDMEDHLYGRFVEPELWVILAAVRLREEARSWFVKEVEEQFIFGDWKRFKTALIDKWSPQHFFRVVSAYHANKQREGETAEGFHARFKLLRDNLPERDPESIAKFLFVNGLESDVREIVLDQCPESVEAAYKTARMVEVLKGTVRESVRESGMADVGPEDVQEGEKTIQEGSEVFNDDSQATSTADTQTASVTDSQPSSTAADTQTAPFTQTAPHFPKASGRQTRPGRPGRSVTKTCYVCEKPGHFAKDCHLSSSCVYCHKDTHVSRLCPDRSYRRGFARSAGNKHFPACFRCHGLGHIAKECTYTFGMTHVRAGEVRQTEQAEQAEQEGAVADAEADAGERAEEASEADEEAETDEESEADEESEESDAIARFLQDEANSEVNSETNSSTSPITKCFRCREIGHLTEECAAPPEMSHMEYTYNNRCFNCKQRRHRDIDCPEPKREEMSDAGDANDANEVQSTAESVASGDSVEPEDLPETQLL